MKYKLGKRKYPFAGSSSGLSNNNLSGNVQSIDDFINQIQSEIGNEALALVPPVIFIHQLYGIVGNNTWVDQQLEQLKNEKRIIMLRMEVDRNDLASSFIRADDVKSHIKTHVKSPLVHKFVDNVLLNIGEASVDKLTLRNRFNVTENGIKELVQAKVLVRRDVGRYWISFPHAGEFIVAYNTGRKYLLGILRRCKYLEAQESDLLKKKLPKKAILGVPYHISDIIGSEDVERVITTSGSTIRLKMEERDM